MCTSWEGEDRESEYTITIYGRTADGKSVSVSTLFNPYFFIKVPPMTTCDQLWQKLVFFEQYGKYKRIDNAPIKFEKVCGKELMGFTNNKQFTFMKFEFTCLEHLRKFTWRCKNNRLKVYESTISPMLRFMHRTGVKSTGWAKVTDYSKAYLTTCDVDIFCKNWKNITPIDCDDIAPIKITSVDIECYSSTGKFPDADVCDDDMFQVAFTTKVYGTNELIQKCFCLKETEGYEWFDSECKLLTAMSEYIVKLDPDIITGWNIFGFDLEYIHKRMLLKQVEPYVFCMGRRRMDPCKIVEKQLSSSALGHNVLKMLPMSGRYIFDLFQTIKAEHKLESYSLNNVSKEFLGDAKIDMPIHELFHHYRGGDVKNLGKVAEYCVKDTELPIRLMDKLYTIENLVEMAKATWVPLNYLSERGQQIKVFSQIAKKARELGFMIPTLDKTKVETEYEGATVLEAQTGAYYKPITALDFEGLYPSIMVAHNLCYSTIVLKPEYDNLPGVVYETHGNHRFAQNVESLLPNILSELKAYRKKAKGEMAKAKGTPMYHIYNGRQLAYKVSMNSVYGFTGAANGMLPLVAIASTVTAQGRFMIQQSKEYVESNFKGSQVRYGDSVLGTTPVLTKYGPIQIQNLGREWTSYPGFLKDGSDKEQSDIEMSVWTHDGWQIARRVIRHKCSKRIYRVLTHTGVVDVTEDHSLLGTDLTQLKPKDVCVGQDLFHSFPHSDDFEYDEKCSVDQAYIYGMFVGDGSCGTYSWAINNLDIHLLTKCKDILETIHKKSFKILDTVESSGVYKLVPCHGDVKSFVNEYRSKCYDGKSKQIPSCVMATKETCESFLNGLWDSDGCRKDCDTLDTKNQITAQWYFVLLKRLGYSVSLNCRSDKNNIYRITWTNSKQCKNPISIKKIYTLYEKYDDYVYDIETDAGTFQAGVGQMIVKNTDSIMVEFDVGERTGVDAIDYSWTLGEKAAKEITKLFKPPNNLELEKVYCPYFLYSKKRYAAKMWVKGSTGMEMEKIDIKGLQVVRRDTCEFVREVCQEVININMDAGDSKAYIEMKKNELLSGQVPMEKLLLSKRLGDSYKSTNLAHLVVRDKIKERAPGSEPRSGDRVQFVIIKTEGKGARMFEKAEDPSWVTKQNLALDYAYYYKHQFEKPVNDLNI